MCLPGKEVFRKQFPRRSDLTDRYGRAEWTRTKTKAVVVGILNLEISMLDEAPDFSLGKLVANIVLKKAPDICYLSRFS